MSSILQHGCTGVCRIFATRTWRLKKTEGSYHNNFRLAGEILLQRPCMYITKKLINHFYMVFPHQSPLPHTSTTRSGLPSPNQECLHFPLMQRLKGQTISEYMTSIVSVPSHRGFDQKTLLTSRRGPLYYVVSIGLAAAHARVLTGTFEPVSNNPPTLPLNVF